jgi:hypothetical protein
MRTEIRADGDRCRECGAPLASAKHVRTSWRAIRSGEFQGGRGEFRYMRCACGALNRMFWSVTPAPYRRDAA